MMAVDEGLIAWVEEATEPLGPLTRRSMMGGTTLYLDGIVFAIVALDQLWFKADAASDPEWDAAGCARFTYPRDGGTATMNYRAAPEEVHDDAEALRRWAQLAVEAGVRAPVRKRRK